MQQDVRDETRQRLILLAIVVVALAVRVYPAWNGVFESGRVNFLETDAVYRIRLIENQVRNFPWRITLDPYAAAGGQYVPIAPLYDTLSSAVVVAIAGRDAATDTVERISVFVPPVLGVLAVVQVWLLGRRLFGSVAGNLAAGLTAILPGHFMDRTMLGFVDHHALEALLALATLTAIARALPPPIDLPLINATPSPPRVAKGRAIAAGLALGLYLLAWGSGALLVAILGTWLLLLIPIARRSDLHGAARVLVVAPLVALALVLAFQDPQMYRYATQVAGLLALAAFGLAVFASTAGVAVTSSLDATRVSDAGVRLRAIAALAVTAMATLALTWWIAPQLIRLVTVDVLRLAPDPSRMGVLEARPLFLYPGEWNWSQPWQFFRTGFYVGAIALVLFIIRIARDRRPADVLVWTFAAAMCLATIGQNRFGYYMVPAFAILGGWLAACLLEWREAPSSAWWTFRLQPARRRELAIIVVGVVLFVPNVTPAVLLASRGGTMAAYWQDTMVWLREHTPPPFTQAARAGDEFYLARYDRGAVPRADYTVLSWWDQGYYLMQRARRVPVANPTQARAPNAARFYTETDETRAQAILAAEGARIVIVDWELPFRLTPDGVMMGRFQNLLDWAGATHANYYEVCYRRDGAAWTPVWIFHEPYYQSLAFRLSVGGGEALVPDHAATLVVVADHTDARGQRFREIVSERTYPTYDAAQQALAARGTAGAMIIGFDPWRSAFPVDAITSLVEVHAARTPEQAETEAPWVRVFEVLGARPSHSMGRVPSAVPADARRRDAGNDSDGLLEAGAPAKSPVM